MGDHNPAVCLFRREVGEFAGDIFVGEAVEAMPLDAPVMECAWDGEGLRQDAAQIRVRPGIQRGLDPLLPLAYLQGQRIVAEIDYAPGDPEGRVRAKRKQADLHGGGASIEGQQGLHPGNPSTGWGAAGRHRIALARQHYGDTRHGQEPSRRRAGEVDQLLGRHVVGFGIRHEQDVGLARDGEAMPLVRAASKLRALSKASGPSTLAPVICPRAAITVSAAVSSRRRHLGVHGLHGGEHRDFRLLHAEPAQEIDRVLADVPLVLQRRLDVDRCVGDDEQLVVGRDVHGIDMAVRNGNDLDTVERDLCGLGGGEKVYIVLADERDDRGGIAGLNLVESLVA